MMAGISRLLSVLMAMFIQINYGAKIKWKYVSTLNHPLLANTQKVTKTQKTERC